MNNNVVCPKCNSQRCRMTDYEPLDTSMIPFDSHLYGKFNCLNSNCNNEFRLELNVVTQDVIPKTVEDKLMIVIDTKIPRKVIFDVFVTALEGGSNYWYSIPDSTIEKVRAVVPKDKCPYISKAIPLALLDHGVDIAINDIENEDEELGVISLLTIGERLQELANESRWALDQELEGNGDAESSDVWLQYLTMGQIVFG